MGRKIDSWFDIFEMRINNTRQNEELEVDTRTLTIWR